MCVLVEAGPGHKYARYARYEAKGRRQLVSNGMCMWFSRKLALLVRACAVSDDITA